MYKNLSDKRAYSNTIGCLMLDPTLIDDIDRPLDRTDFNTESFYELIFVAIYNLCMNGCQTIDEFAIDSYLKDYKKQYTIFQENNGLEYLANAKELADLGNYDYYYHRMRKFSLLRYYEKSGLDTRFIYDPTASEKALDNENRKFDEYTEQDIVEIVESKLVIEPNMKWCTNTLSTNIQASSGLEDLIDEYMRIPDVGLPLNNDGLNTVTRGARLGCLYMRSLIQGQGKAIPNYTIIPTPSGNKRVDEIREGDYLFGRDGKPTKVLKVHPQTEKKRVYKIIFNDGRTAECCEDHLWTYKTYKNGQYKTRALKDIIAEINHREHGLKDSRDSSYVYRIPITEAVQFDERQYSIPPYIMGLLLGDGCFRYSSSNKEIYYSSEDDYLPSVIADTMGWELNKNSDKNYTYSFSYKEFHKDCVTNKKYKKVRVEDVLKDYPELILAYSHEKYIPVDYLYGSVGQRYALLRGLLDTDGHVDEKGRVGFSTTSEKLKDGFINLVRGLGFIATVREDNRNEHTCYEITIIASISDKLKMFSLPKHLKKLRERANEGIVFHNEEKCLRIKEIIETDQFVEMTCFTVDAEDSLFLMNDYIVTHNTRLAAADACKMSVPYVYDEDKKDFTYTGLSEPTLYITTEMTCDEIQTIFLAFISKVNEEHILYGEYVGDELDRVKKAIKYIESSPLYIVHIPDFSIEDIKNIIKKYNREYNVRYFFFDYIMSSLRLISEVSNKSRTGLKEHQLLLIFSTELKTIAQQLNVFIFTASQLNGEASNATYKDQNLLSGAKALSNKLDVGLISMKPSPAELRKLEAVMRNMIGIPEPNMGHWIYKVRRGRLTRIIIWSRVDLGTMTEKALFVTDYDFELINIDFTKIESVEAKIREHSILESQVRDEPVIEDTDETEEIEEAPKSSRKFNW